MYGGDDQLATLMRALAARHGWAYRAPDAGRYAIVVDLGLEISLFQVDGDLFLEGDVAALPSSRADRDELLRRLLRLQAGRLGRCDQALILSDGSSVDGTGSSGPGASQRLQLYQRLALEHLQFEDFERALAGFVAALDLWCRAAAHSHAAQRPLMPGAGILIP